MNKTAVFRGSWIPPTQKTAYSMKRKLALKLRGNQRQEKEQETKTERGVEKKMMERETETEGGEEDR